MTQSLTEESPMVVTDEDMAVDDSELHHFWCCDPEVAYCGEDLSDTEDVDTLAPDAEVCDTCQTIFDHRGVACVPLCPANNLFA